MKRATADLDLFAVNIPPSRRFDGSTYEAGEDAPRLTRQLQAVREAMLDGRWWTLAELATAADCSTQSASARVRDLRKAKFGSHTVERRRVEGGLYQYRIAARGGEK